MAKKARASSHQPLTESEREGIRVAVQSAFLKLRNLYAKIVPAFESYGFTPPSAGVIARDLSEKIEASIIQHCDSFEKGVGYFDLSRFNANWEVKVCKNSGMTINQSKVIGGENYIVVNYKADTVVTRIWVLWNAKDEYFSPRKANANARSLMMHAVDGYIDVIYRKASAQSTK